MAKKNTKKFKTYILKEQVFFYLYDKHIICKLHKNNTGI